MMTDNSSLDCHDRAHNAAIRRPHSATLHSESESYLSRSPPPPAPMRHSYTSELKMSPPDGSEHFDSCFRFSERASPLSLEVSLQTAVEELAELAADLSAPSQPLVWTEDQDTWQQRCLHLEINLQRLREQNRSIRNVVNNKLVELEHRTIESEHRAEQAEQNARLLEQRLASVSLTASSGSDQLDALRSSVQQRDSAINQLQSQVDEQKLIRLNEAKQVEAKAAKIKEWVTNKLKDLEDQNRYLREQNRRCNEQMELLKCRLDQLSEYRCKQRISMEQDSSRGSYEDRPESDGSFAVCDHLAGRTIYADFSHEPKCPIIPRTSPSQHHQRRQHDVSSRIARGTADTAPPPVSLERKQFCNPRFSGTSLARSSCASRADSGSVDLETPHELTPLSPCPAVSRPAGESAVLDSIESRNTTRVPHSITRTAAAQSSSRKKPRVVDEENDYSEIFTPTDESSTAGRGNKDESLPPTPPQHRVSLLESKLCQMAMKGIQSPSVTLSPPATNSDASITRCCFSEESVPVFVSVQGRASQIGWSGSVDQFSDSSDGEDCVTTRSGHGGSTTPTDPSFPESGDGPPATPRSGSRVLCTRRSSHDKAVKSRFSPGKIISPTKESRRVAASPHSELSSAGNCNGDINTKTDRPNSSLKSVRSLEKSGYLTKLSGKLKTWRKRWFAVKDNKLMYWKSQHEVSRKSPHWQTDLDDRCQVTCQPGSLTFSVSTGEKVIHLSCDSQSTVQEWVRLLQNILRRSSVRLLLSERLAAPTMQGWLTRVKNGHTRRFWCLLVGKMLLYFRTKDCTSVSGQLNLRDCRVQEMSQCSDTDDDAVSPDHDSSLTIGLFPSIQNPTYLVTANKAEKDAWLYHLSVVSRGGGVNGTQFETLVSDLMEASGDPQSALWKDPLLLPSKEPPAVPLTSIPEDLRSEATKLFKSCQLFSSVMVDSAAVDYHVALAQHALNIGCDFPKLQDELLSVLVKQTSRSVPNKHAVQNLLLCATQSLFICDSGRGKAASDSPPALSAEKQKNQADGVPVATAVDEQQEETSRTRELPYVLLQSWQLLALAVSLFVPRNSRLLWLLRLHLQRHQDPSTETGKYASYCQRALERTLICGGRQVRPSRMEVLSILLKNPQHHSLPHAIPVHLSTGTYQVVGFDGSTSVGEFVRSLNEQIGCRDVSQSGFALFSDDPVRSDVQHALLPELKLCDVISRWETALREKRCGRVDTTRLIRLSFRSRLHWTSLQADMPDREKLLHVHHTCQRIRAGLFPLSKELALELTALLSQIEYGDYTAGRQAFGATLATSTGSSANYACGGVTLSEKCLQRFYPPRYLANISGDDRRVLSESLAEKWNGLRGRSSIECVRIYLSCVRQWPHFHATLFAATIGDSSSSNVLLSVSEKAIAVLDAHSLVETSRFGYESVLTFGGSQRDFMLVVSSAAGSNSGNTSEKHLFHMERHQIVELTLLMADYINSPGGGQKRGQSHHGTLTRGSGRDSECQNTDSARSERSFRSEEDTSGRSRTGTD